MSSFEHLLARKSTLKFLYLLRLSVCLLPEHSYIQPDEFFQFTEPIAGDVLGVKTYLPWEFTSSTPIRSIFFPLLIAGSSFKFLEKMKAFGAIISPWHALVLPRLAFTILSFSCDASIWLICKKRSSSSNLIKNMAAFASSYIALTYVTHTFTNSIETMLFGLLLCLATNESKSTFHELLMGILLSLGFFNRQHLRVLLQFQCFGN